MPKTLGNHEPLSARVPSRSSAAAVVPGAILMMAFSVSPAIAADPSSHGESMMKQGPMHDHAGMHGEASTGATGQGLINSVDRPQGIVNMTHAPIPALSWPEMTMDLPVAEGVDLEAIRAGDAVRFRVELGSDQVYRITAIEAMP